jgi:phosphate transport system permease protein
MIEGMRHDRVRRVTSAVMTSLTALCTLLAIGILLVILAYIAWKGIGSLSLRFLIDSPRPVGEGGGIGNAILGSVVLLALSSAFGLPIGISVGIYLSEIGTGRLAGAVRFIADTLTGIPSIVTGVFVYANPGLTYEALFSVCRWCRTRFDHGAYRCSHD